MSLKKTKSINETIKKSTAPAKRKLRLPLLSWLLLPLLGLWLASSFFIELKKLPDWASINPEETVSVLGSTVEETSPAIPPFTWKNTGLVTFWFDDGWETQFSEGFSHLSSNKLPGALAISTKLVGLPAYMSWYQIRKAHFSGWEIVSHSRTHDCSPQKMTQFQQDYEMRGSQDDLDRMGMSTAIYVTPCGESNNITLEIAKRYYAALRGSESGFNKLPITDPYAIHVQIITPKITTTDVKKWLETAKNSKSWLILMFHQIDNTNADYGTTPAMFHDMVSEVLASKLPVVLPSQALSIQ